MTNEEAIKWLEEDIESYETSICHAGDGTPDGELLEALDMAIDALESRQMPESEMREMLQDIVTAQSLINRTVSRLNRFLFSEVKKE